jgi:hypothetical protein
MRTKQKTTIKLEQNWRRVHTWRPLGGLEIFSGIRGEYYQQGGIKVTALMLELVDSLMQVPVEQFMVGRELVQRS